jgi:hypothetical protein
MGKIARIYHTYHTYINNNRESAMSTVSTSNGRIAQNAHSPDPRFRSQKFRDAVHYCLEYLGLPHTMTEFRRLDSQLNWIELARNLSGQRYTGPEYDLEIVARDFPGRETK